MKVNVMLAMRVESFWWGWGEVVGSWDDRALTVLGYVTGVTDAVIW